MKLNIRCNELLPTKKMVEMIYAFSSILVHQLLLKFSLSAGQRNDITQAEYLTTDVLGTTIIADKAYYAKKFINQFSKSPCIPPRKNAKVPLPYDEYLYEERYVIECFFGKIKHFRRIFSRYDKSALSYISFLYFVAALIWIR